MVQVMWQPWNSCTNGPFGWGGGRGGVEQSRVKLGQNQFIFSLYYSIPLHSPSFSPPSKQAISVSRRLNYYFLESSSYTAQTRINEKLLRPLCSQGIVPSYFWFIMIHTTISYVDGISVLTKEVYYQSKSIWIRVELGLVGSTVCDIG